VTAESHLAIKTHMSQTVQVVFWRFAKNGEDTEARYDEEV